MNSPNGDADRSLQEQLQDFEVRLAARIGASAAAEWRREVGQIIDLVIIEARDGIEPWALKDSDAKIPIDRINKDGILDLLRNPEFISMDELLDVLRYRTGGGV